LQDYNIAVKTIRAIKESGADAVKLQTFTPDTITMDSDNKYFKIRQGTLWDGKTLYELYRDAYMPWEWQPRLKKIANKSGLIFFSTPFDKTAVDFLEKMGVPAYKVASFEITDIPLIQYIASKNKPVMISTGIATKKDIEEAVKACKRMKNDKIVLLKCVSSYPALLEELNLKRIPMLKRDFKSIIGLSDHTLETCVSIAAVALGAKVIEKHFILDRKLGGPDAKFSLEPEEFKNMVRSIRETESALGEASYRLPRKNERNKEFSRSLFIVKDIREQEVFTEENVRSIRPGFGLHPKYFDRVIGRKAVKAIKRGTPLKWDMISRV
jgi:pseudaminic acid synthase